MRWPRGVTVCVLPLPARLLGLPSECMRAAVHWRMRNDACAVARLPFVPAGGTPDPRLLQRAALVSQLALRRLDGRIIQGLAMHLHVGVGVGAVDL
jgi:hypothetical protein